MPTRIHGVDVSGIEQERQDLAHNYGHGSKAASRPLRTPEACTFSYIVKMSVVIVLAKRSILDGRKLLVK